MRRAPHRRHEWVADALALVLLLGAALLLRLWHLGRPSLWWDEIVQVHSALGPGFLDVWRTVRDGVPRGLGNAGAVPLDYLLLHAWMRLASWSDPAGLESYFRTPSLLWSTLAVAAVFLWARRFFDRSSGVFAALLLATSVPHISYAVEARFYSLFSLLTVVSLAAFSRLLEARTLGGWLGFTVTGSLLFLCGLPGLFLLALQYAILLVVVAGDLRRSGNRKGLATLAGSAVVLAGVVLAYYADTYWGVRFGRGRTLSILPLTASAFESFSSSNDLLLGLFLVSVPLVLRYGQRRGAGRLAITLYLVGSFLAIPALLLLARQREYYFHFRHVLFLLPHFALVTGAGLAVALRALLGSAPGRRGAWHLLLGIAVVLTLQLAPLRSYLAEPERFLSTTKTLRDLRGLTEQLRSRLARMAPGEKYLLIAEKRRPGHLANPSLAKYLVWYGLDDRVLLRGSDHPEETLREVASRCDEDCRHRDVLYLPILLRLPGPFGIRPEIRSLLRLPPIEETRAAPLGGVGIVSWERSGQRPPAPGARYDVTPRRGATFYDLRGFSPGAS